MRLQVRILVQPIGLLAVLFLSLWRGATVPAVAQSSAITWSESINLSNTPQYSSHPAIVADDYGYVHVFWSEDVNGAPVPLTGFQDRIPSGNSILYSRWDGVSWTPPTDILFVPDELIAEYVAVGIDADNRLHAVWTGQSNFYYSNAPSLQALSAHAWSRPVTVATDSARSRNESDVVADASGKVHILYATRGREAGIYHILSSDGGASWESAAQLSNPFDSQETSFSNVKAIADSAGRLHAVWQTNQYEGYGQAVYYARSADGGQSWSAPAQLGYRGPDDVFVSWPFLMSRGEFELHLIYTNGTNVGRAHRISTDAGETWSDAHHMIPEMEGINGYVVPATDGAGQMHLIVNMRTRAEQVVGIYYAYWLDDGWSAVVPVDAGSQATSHAHWAAVAVRLGNELHVVWNEIVHGEIWHTRGIIPSAYQTPPLHVPSRQTPTPLAMATAETVLQTPAPPRRPVGPAPYSTGPALGSPITDPRLALTIGAPLLLVICVVIWTRVRSR